ncbi:MAG: hypothetical protein ACHQ2Y_09720 [Candidatus Lutacidiplasmatales archaeon]
MASIALLLAVPVAGAHSSSASKAVPAANIVFAPPYAGLTVRAVASNNTGQGPNVTCNHWGEPIPPAFNTSTGKFTMRLTVSTCGRSANQYVGFGWSVNTTPIRLNLSGTHVFRFFLDLQWNFKANLSGRSPKPGGATGFQFNGAVQVIDVTVGQSWYSQPTILYNSSYVSGNDTKVDRMSHARFSVPVSVPLTRHDAYYWIVNLDGDLWADSSSGHKAWSEFSMGLGGAGMKLLAVTIH